MKYPNIELERIKSQLTKTQFTEEIGIVLKTYQNWQEIGNIPSSKIIKMSELFKCSSDYLLGLDIANNKTG